MKKTLVGLSIFLLAFTLCAAESNETASSLFQQGVAAYDAGDTAGALKLFRKMQEDFPRSARAIRGWEYIALCENKLGDPYAAFEAYQQIWDNHKEFSKMQVITRNQMRIGNHYMEYKRYSVAEKIFSKILENAPYSEAAPAAQYSLGMAQYNLKKYAQARESFEAVCSNFPTSQLVDDSAFMLGVVDSAAAVEADYDQTSTDRAIASFRNYIREFPTAEHVGDAQQHIRALRDRKAQSLYDQAYYYDYSGHAKSAIMHYELLIAEYPDTNVADKAKVRLAALRGESVQNLPKDTVTYVDKTPDAGPVSPEASKTTESTVFVEKETTFKTPQAESAPFEETTTVTTTTIQKNDFTSPSPENVADSIEKRQTALAKPSSTMAQTGDDWTVKQSKQVINEYLQDSSKKKELLTFMNEEYAKEAETQAASQELLKLYQESNPSAVPPPASELSASAYVERQVAKETKTVSQKSVEKVAPNTFETRTETSVAKVENVWAPVPGTEVKASKTIEVDRSANGNVSVTETKVVEEVKTPVVSQPTTSVAATRPKTPGMTQPESVVVARNWNSINDPVEFKEEVIVSPPPKITSVNSSELEGIKSSGTTYNKTYAPGSSATPSFTETSSGQTTSVSVTTPSVSKPSSQVSAPSFETVTVTTTSPDNSTTKLSTDYLTAEVKAPGNSSVTINATPSENKTEKLVSDLLPTETKPLTVTVSTNTVSPKVNREVARPSFEETQTKIEEKIEQLQGPTTVSVKVGAADQNQTTGPRLTKDLQKPVFEDTTTKVEEKVEKLQGPTTVSVKVGATDQNKKTGATVQDVTNVLPEGLQATDPNSNAIVETPKGTVLRQMSDVGRVSTAISQTQYKRVVEEKNVKEESSETVLINEYKNAYNLVQRAESYARQNDNVNARFYYGQALDAFTALKVSAPPDWRHMEILDTRIQKCREELHRLD